MVNTIVLDFGDLVQFSRGFLSQLAGLSYADIAFEGARLIIEDEIDEQSLREIVEDAFSFDVVVKNVHDNINVLELFHGPTLAFKDFGAKFLANTMAYLNRNSEKEIIILVATSGDTGSAVANGFYRWINFLE